jgi:hypothetical protein
VTKRKYVVQVRSKRYANQFETITKPATRNDAFRLGERLDPFIRDRWSRYRVFNVSTRQRSV